MGTILQTQITSISRRIVLLFLFVSVFSKISAQSSFVTAVCHDITIALDANGTYTLTPINIGSLSQGSVTPIGLKRIDVTPSHFSCVDIPGDSVEVKVIDINNHFDICHAYITIKDVTPPVFDSIPTPIPDVVCYEGTLPEQEVLTGTDECGTPIMTPIVDPYIENVCDGFSVTYRWKLVDSTGNRVEKTTSFDVLPDTIAPHFDFMPDSIPDLSCSGQLQIQQILTATDENCRQVEVIPSIDPYTEVPCASYEVTYRWSLSDECGNAAEDVLRSYHVQPDTVAPNIVCPQNQTFILGEVHIKLLAFDDCSDVTTQYKIDFGNNGSFDRVRLSDVIEGDIPLGTHRVLWTVSDECGNMLECTHMFTVTSGMAPEVFCKTGLVYYVKENGCIRVAAHDLMDHATDVETADSVVMASVRARVTDDDVFSDSISFCCQELGVSTFELQVTDEHGNTGTCLADLIVGDNHNYCASRDTIGDISGVIKTVSGQGIPNVVVSLGNLQTTTTAANGYYEFTDLDYGKNYNILVQSDADHSKGLSVSDILYLANYILTGTAFDNPYSKFASDVNRDGRINVKDIIVLRKVILKIEPKFKYSKSWLFFNSEFDPSTASLNNIHAIYPVIHFSSDVQLDFIGVKTGDVNGSVNPRFKNDETQERSSNTTYFYIENQALSPNKVVDVDFYASDFIDFEGFQMALQYDKDKVDWLGIESKKLIIEDETYNHDSEQGLIYFAWNGERQSIKSTDVLFTLKMLSKSVANLKDVIKLSERNMPSEWVSDDVSSDLKLLFKPMSQEENSVIPNPFDENTRVYFENTDGKEVSLKVFSINGQLIYHTSSQFEKGRSYFEVNQRDLANAGVYIYEITTNSDTFIGKMILK